MSRPNPETVLLFYKDFERDSWFPYDRYLKRLVRPLYHRLSRRQKVSGFLMWFQLLVKALTQQGYRVRVNDYAFARRHPEYPVGLVGYPHLLDGWRLPNPAVLGPALFDHPKVAPNLMDDRRFRLYLVTCQWMEDMFRPFYGPAAVRWYAGMDVAQWQDTRHAPKSVDVLIYDKIRWNRPEYEPGLLNPIQSYLDRCGYHWKTVRYGQYDHAAYHRLLQDSRAMIFLCEHETQGLAYQEALASNIPVFAWDNGYWLDPNRPKYEPRPVPASSVPYFSPECGERFKAFDEFERAFEWFWQNRENYQPRRFVETQLSLRDSAELYMTYYRSLMSKGQT